MQRNSFNGLARQLKRSPKPLWLVIVMHILILGAALMLYALFHHVIPRQGQAVGLQSARGGAVEAMAVQPTQAPVQAAEVASTATPVPTATPEPTPEPGPVGYFGEKFADKFIEGKAKYTSDSYVSRNVNVTVSSGEFMGSSYHVADIYIKDISCLVTAFAKDKYGKGYASYCKTFAEQHGAIVTINGDYYGMRDNGVVIRNGTLYRDEKVVNDVCVIYWDGSMKNFDPFNFDAETEIANGAYQAWCFGPYLLDANGEIPATFNSAVKKANPRSVIGYYEPGHYCFVAVDGREEDSVGLSMDNTALLMKQLGCTLAYNLDGGQSSSLLKGTTLVNNPVDGGRGVSDAIMILDIDSDQGGAA